MPLGYDQGDLPVLSAPVRARRPRWNAISHRGLQLFAPACLRSASRRMADTTIKLFHYKKYGYNYEDFHPRQRFSSYTVEITYPDEGDRP